MVNIEASSSGAAAPSPHTLLSVTVRPPPPPAAGPITTTTIPPPPTDAADGPSSSSNTSSYSGTESEDEDGGEASRKRKRERREAPEGSGKMMAFFEGLIKEVMDQQETMLQRFLEAIERREQNRMIREEAWRRQEKSRISREHELVAQERAAAASRDDAIISFLQKLTGQKIPIPPPPQPPETTVDPAEETPTSPPPPPRPEDPDQPPKETTLGSSSRRTIEAPILSSRWPKSEVHALINLRSGMESKYLDSIPKGPLWEEISACMGRLGYDRSAKRCKEKWENINKYYKKVKESNKNRPEDAKTCPYFHQLDALYRAKILGGSSSAGTAGQTLSTDDHQLAISSPTAAIIKQQDDRMSFFEQGSSSASLVKKVVLSAPPIRCFSLANSIKIALLSINSALFILKPEDIVKKKIEQAVVESESKKMETGVSFRFRMQQYIMPRVLISGGTGQQLVGHGPVERSIPLFYFFYIYINIIHN
ncbi:Trihelix transcription factor GT-2 [Dendrobium catenatum]|uniref:Trihelix transcription factor GT-2 n=1 Tax=Dendrobium catenatum TaxID=906689 RepID=A0A2I0XE13_9ASPA|nr:Trihelix transcription factor GT-2 [Dendrobium catenatum]